MSLSIGSFSPDRSAMDTLPPCSSGKHLQLFSLPPGDPLHARVLCTLGVILSGPRNLHHVVILEEDDSCPVYNDFKAFSDVVFACGSNFLMPSGVPFTLQSSDTLDSNILLLGITVHSNGFSFVGLKPYVKQIVSTTSTPDLLNKVANMQDRPKRKRSMIAPVFMKGVGQLRTHAAHDAAHVWIIFHAHDAVKVDFVPQRGERKSTSLVRRFQVKNLKDEYVVVRTLKECIEYVQGRTGRNFWDDMLYDGDSYDLTSIENLKKMSCEDADDSESVTTHPPDRSLHDDLFGSDSDWL